MLNMSLVRHSVTVTKQYNLLPVKGQLPCDWGVQTLFCVWVAGKTVIPILHTSRV